MSHERKMVKRKIDESEESCGICPKCSKSTGSGSDHLVECLGCQVGFHKSCYIINGDLYKVYEDFVDKNEDFPFYPLCTECRDFCKNRESTRAADDKVTYTDTADDMDVDVSNDNEGPFRKNPVEVDNVKDSDENDDDSDDPNPFLIEPVLKVLFSQMSLYDLKKARLVSSLWNQQSVSCLENQIRTQKDRFESINISADIQSIVKYYKTVKNHHLFPSFFLNYANYTRYMEKNGQDIIEDHRLTKLAIDYNRIDTVDLDEMFNIFTRISSTIVCLGILNVKKCTPCSKADMMSKTPEFKNLESFIFSTDFTQGSTEYVDLIEVILSKCPSMKNIGVDYFPNKDQNLINMLLMQRETVPGSPIVFDSEKIKKLKVKELGITLPFNYDRNVPLSSLLRSQSQYLTKLSINLDIHYQTVFTVISLPVCPQVQHLSLTLGLRHKHESDGDNDCWSRLEPFSFAIKFPNLKKLEVNELGQFEKVVTGGSKTLEKLIMNPIETAVVTYDKIEELFPNVRDFKMDVEDMTKNGEEIPWRNGLEKLTIIAESFFMLENLNFEHLKALKILSIECPYVVGTDKPNYLDDLEKLHEYFGTIKKSTQIKLLLVKFADFTNEEEKMNPEIKNKIHDKISEIFSDTDIKVKYDREQFKPCNLNFGNFDSLIRAKKYRLIESDSEPESESSNE